jgi:predicted dehydrogenase
MYPHFRYMIENILGQIERVASTTTTAVPERIDEHGERYAVDVEDHTATLVTLKSGAIGSILASWATRVRRDDLMTFQIDGTRGSAVAGLHRCYAQSIGDTPKVAAFNPMTDLRIDYASRWQEAPAAEPYTNPYRVGWEDFLRHLVAGTRPRSDFAAGIRDVAFAEACYRSLKSGASVRLDDVLS